MKNKEKLLLEFKKDIYDFLDHLINNYYGNGVYSYQIEKDFYFKYKNSIISKEQNKQFPINSYFIKIKGLCFDFDFYYEDKFSMCIRKVNFRDESICLKDLIMELKLEIDSYIEKEKISKILYIKEVNLSSVLRKRL